MQVSVIELVTINLLINHIPTKSLVNVLEEQMGGTPEHGSRNNFIFSMACHLRYICNDDPDWIAQVLPTYGEAQEKWMTSIRSACARNQTKTMPRIMRRTLAICKERMEDNSELRTHNSEFRTQCSASHAHRFASAYQAPREQDTQDLSACRGACSVPCIGSAFVEDLFQVHRQCGA